MVDIHTHVLPGLDDGARTIEESLEMLKMAAGAGTTDVVATPHANSEFIFDQQRVQRAFQDLSNRSDSFVKLHLGCDFHLNHENLQQALNDPEKYTINNGPYLMLELPDVISELAVRQALRSLLDVGISPIITHPERNVSVQARADELKRWVGEGCFLQITGQSLLGRFGTSAQKAADNLLRAELVHFVASDAHGCTDRTPDLSKAYDYVYSRYGGDRAEELFVENPHSVLSGESIEGRPLARGKAAGLFGFWK